MHRSAQRSQQHQRAGRPGGSGRGRRLLVAAAAVPVLLMAAACSSDSGSDSGGDAKGQQDSGASASASPTPSATVQAAAYDKLPDACSVFAKDTLKDLVPEGTKSGKAINAGEPDVSGDCRWTSLSDNGVDGSQYRWLSVSMLRLDSDEARGAGDERARQQYEKRVTEARSVDGAKDVKAEPVTGTGDEATVVRYDLKKKEGSFKQQTIVVRAENVVISLDYNGAGLAGDKTPDADELVKLTKAAAKEAVAAVTEANGASGSSSAPSGSADAPDSGDQDSGDKAEAGSGSAVQKDSDADSSDSSSKKS